MLTVTVAHSNDPGTTNDQVSVEAHDIDGGCPTHADAALSCTYELPPGSPVTLIATPGSTNRSFSYWSTDDGNECPKAMMKCPPPSLALPPCRTCTFSLTQMLTNVTANFIAKRPDDNGWYQEYLPTFTPTDLGKGNNFKGIFAIQIQTNTDPEVFVVGQSGTILHLFGNMWMDESYKDPMNGSATGDLYAIWGYVTMDQKLVMYAVGDGLILQKQENNWIRYDKCPGKPLLRGVWGDRKGKMNAVGPQSTILAWDTTSCTPVVPPMGSPDYDFTGVFGPVSFGSKSVTFAAGSMINKLGRSGAVCMLTMPSFDCAESMSLPDKGLLLNGIGGIDDSIWVVGETGLIAKGDSPGSWNKPTSSLPRTTFHGIWARPETAQAWVVGDSGTIVYFNGSEWITAGPGTSSGKFSNLNSVSGSGKNVWAAGDAGTVLHYQGP